MKTFSQPLTASEEAYYLRLLKEGSGEEAMRARNILIERNLRLVAHIAKKYQNVDEDMEDLISIGTIGLIKAISSFDAVRGKLSTYASRCIDNELLMMLRNDRKKLMELSLSEPIGTDKEGNDITFMDIVGDEERDDVAQLLLEEQLNCIKTHMKDVLNKREIYIICGRYGLGGGKEKTQNELADKLGISRSYVSRIEQKALEKLYNLLGSYRLL